MSRTKEDNYIYYNRRPDGQHLNDCVTRAISTATGMKYSTVAKLLEMTANYNECEKLCVCCYKNLLSDVLDFEFHFCDAGETVSDIAERYNDGKVIIRIDQHLTCAMFGKVYDIWNCTDERADCYWVVA